MTDTSGNSGASEWVRVALLAIVLSGGLTAVIAIIAGVYWIGSGLWG